MPSTVKPRLPKNWIIGIIVLLVVVASVLTLRMLVYNASVHSDITAFSTAVQASGQGSARPISSLDQVSVSDTARLHYEQRGYSFQRQSGQSFRLCAHYYDNPWSVRPTQLKCQTYGKSAS